MSPYVRPSGDKISQNLVSLRILNEIIFSFYNAIWTGNIDDSKEIAPKPISAIARRLIGSEVEATAYSPCQKRSFLALLLLILLVDKH